MRDLEKKEKLTKERTAPERCVSVSVEGGLGGCNAADRNGNSSAAEAEEGGEERKQVSGCKRDKQLSVMANIPVKRRSAIDRHFGWVCV